MKESPFQKDIALDSAQRTGNALNGQPKSSEHGSHLKGAPHVETLPIRFKLTLLTIEMVVGKIHFGACNKPHVVECTSVKWFFVLLENVARGTTKNMI